MNARIGHALVLAASLWGPATLALAADGRTAEAEHPFSKAFQAVAPAVVRVMGGQAYASGLVVSDDGLLVTHRRIVTRNAMPITLADGSKLTARTLIRDDKTQLAVLQILAGKEGETGGSEEKKDSPPPQGDAAKGKAAAWRPAPLGSSAGLTVGSWVATVAYPFGSDAKERTQPSLSAGLLAARGQIPTKMGYKEEFLLTDAATNAGSEGGALVDADGRVVGILCQPQHHEETNTALNLALPIEVLAELLKRARENPDPPVVEEDFASKKHGYLGVFHRSGAQECVVGDVMKDSPAEKAGLKAGDTIVKAGEENIASFQDLVKFLQKTKPGDKISLTVKRPGQDKELQIEVELTRYPQQDAEQEKKE